MLINSQSKENGERALTIAMGNNSKNIVDALLDRANSGRLNADPMVETDKHHYFRFVGDETRSSNEEEVIKWRPKSALSVAARYGHLEIMKKLIAAGPDVSAETEIGQSNHSSHNRPRLSISLRSAIKHGNNETVSVLLQYGAKSSASLAASMYGDIKLLETLFRKGSRNQYERRM